jgi:uncharacterized protein YegL
MTGQPINELNQAIQQFAREVRVDSLAAQRVEVAIISFASTVDVIQPFVTVDEFQPPYIPADGLTRMGGGIQLALQLIEQRKAEYRQHGISYFRPWLFLITDGQPEGEDPSETMRAFQELRQAEQGGKINFWPIGTGSANMQVLSSIGSRRAQFVNATRFADLFVWLSRSMQIVSNSRPQDQISLPPLDWASTKV